MYAGKKIAKLLRANEKMLSMTRLYARRRRVDQGR